MKESDKHIQIDNNTGLIFSNIAIIGDSNILLGAEYTYVSKALEERIVINSLQRLVTSELLEWLESKEKEDWWMDGMIIRRKGYNFTMIDEDNLINAEISGDLLIVLVKVFLSIKDYSRISTIRQ